MKLVLTRALRVAFLIHSVHAALAARHEISICNVCEMLDASIQNVGGSEAGACVPDVCMKSGKMELFLREAGGMLGNSTLERRGADPSLLALNWTDTDVVTNVLVYALLGRHLIEQHQAQDVTTGTVFLYEYDVQRQTLVLRRPLCAYQRQVYSTLLVLTTVILLAGVALRAHEKMREAEEKSAVPLTEPAHQLAEAPQWRIPIGSMGSGVRYRSLPQHA
jgi:hypothetical protein